jgi:hypothetical protein
MPPAAPAAPPFAMCVVAAFLCATWCCGGDGGGCCGSDGWIAFGAGSGDDMPNIDGSTAIDAARRIPALNGRFVPNNLHVAFVDRKTDCG